MISAALLAATSACGDTRSEKRGRSTPPATGAATNTVNGDATVVCELTAPWRWCSVEERLERSGLAPRLQPDSVRHPFLKATGRAYLVGDARLEVFLYSSAVDRAADSRLLDSARVAPLTGSAPVWPAPPTLLLSDNLLAILLSDNGRQIERVTNAITAGLPAAPSATTARPW